MSPEELFEQNMHLAEVTINRMYNNPVGICRKHRIEYDDLLQYAKTGLWKSCLSFKSEKSKFTTHAINNIKWHVTERLNRETSLIKYNCNRDYDPSEIYGIVSMDVEINNESVDHNTYHDIVASNVDVEANVMDGFSEKYMLSRLTEKQRKVVELNAKGLNRAQISRVLNTSRQEVRVKLESARRRLEGLGYKTPIRKKINRSKGRKVYIEGKIYDRIKDASIELNIKQNTICDRMKSESDRFREWHYID